MDAQDGAMRYHTLSGYRADTLHDGLLSVQTRLERARSSKVTYTSYHGV